jgi:hypothetical protein
VPHGDAAGSYAYHVVLIDKNYMSQDAATARGGCPFGPKDYITYPWSTVYTEPQAPKGSYGLAGNHQSGWGRISWSDPDPFLNTSGTAQRPARFSEPRMTKHASRVGLVMCSINPWTGRSDDVAHPVLFHTLGVPTVYLIPAFRRHNGEVLPFTFVDGHGELVDVNTITQINQGLDCDPTIKNVMYYTFAPKYHYRDLDG